MEDKQDGILVKVTSAFVLNGEVIRAGELVEVTDAEARNLLHRGKVELATDEDLDAAGIKPAPAKPAKKTAKPAEAE